RFSTDGLGFLIELGGSISQALRIGKAGTFAVKGSLFSQVLCLEISAGAGLACIGCLHQLIREIGNDILNAVEPNGLSHFLDRENVNRLVFNSLVVLQLQSRSDARISVAERHLLID